MESGGIERQFVIEGIILTIIGIIGLIGNIGAVFHFAQYKRFKHRFYALMLALSLIDILVIASFIWFCSVPEFLDSTRSSLHWSLWIYPILNTLVTASIFLTVAISLDRYLAICKPLWYHASTWRLKHVLFPIFIFSIIYNIPRYFELEWINLSISEVPFMKVWPTKLRRNPTYVECYTLWSHIIILGALPMVLLMVLNLMTMKEMTKYKGFHIGDKKKHKEREIQINMAHINIAIVVVFIICHSFIQIPSVYHVYQLNDRRRNNPERVTDWEHKDLIQTLTEISQIMVVFNSSVNFYVYLIKRKIKLKMDQKEVSLQTNC